MKVSYTGIKNGLPAKLQDKLDTKFSKLSKLVDGHGEWYTPWDQITRVTCATKNGVQLFRVQTADPDSYFTYDSFTFTRPKTIAMRVAAACGKPLENVKWDE